MHIIHEEIGLPKMTMTAGNENVAQFVIAPLPSGYGMTLGNALRRVLLSSIPGAAITAVRIEGASHEYMTLSGMKDSVLDLCLNLKEVALRKHGKNFEIATLSKKGEGDLLAKDIAVSSDIEILNPDVILTNMSKKAGGLKMEVKIEKGVGYLPAAEQQIRAEEGENWIYLDATFSPVLKAKYEVTNTRVGDKTNLDKLVLDVETNGSLTPEESMKFSAALLSSYFNLFQKGQEEMIEADFMASSSSTNIVKKESVDETAQESYTPIEVLNLSPRTLNALINGEIGSIEELVRCSSAKLENLRGFGKKAMDEVRDILATRGLSLIEDEE